MVTVLTTYDTWDDPPSHPSYFPLERHLDRLGVQHGLCRGEGLGDDHHLEVVRKSLAVCDLQSGGVHSLKLTANSPLKKVDPKIQKTADTNMNRKSAP